MSCWWVYIDFTLRKIMHSFQLRKIMYGFQFFCTKIFIHVKLRYLLPGFYLFIYLFFNVFNRLSFLWQWPLISIKILNKMRYYLIHFLNIVQVGHSLVIPAKSCNSYKFLQSILQNSAFYNGCRIVLFINTHLSFIVYIYFMKLL